MWLCGHSYLQIRNGSREVTVHAQTSQKEVPAAILRSVTDSLGQQSGPSSSQAGFHEGTGKLTRPLPWCLHRGYQCSCHGVVGDVGLLVPAEMVVLVSSVIMVGSPPSLCEHKAELDTMYWTLPEYLTWINLLKMCGSATSLKKGASVEKAAGPLSLSG